MWGAPKNSAGNTVGIQKVGDMAGVIDGLRGGRGVAILGSNREQSRVLPEDIMSLLFEDNFLPKTLFLKHPPHASVV